MTALRKVIFIAAVPLGLAAILLVLACLPAVQTWVARRVLAGQPDSTASLDRLSVGWGGATVTGLVLEQPGLKITLPSAEIDLPVLAAARGQIDITRLVAHGWIVELTSAPKSSGPDNTGLPDPREVFDALQLPFALSLADVDLSGQVRQADGVADVKLTGGGLRDGAEGRFDLDVVYRPVNTAGLPADSIQLDATLAARLRDTQVIDKLDLDLTAKAGPHTLFVNLDSQRTDTDTHQLAVRLADHALVDLQLQVPPASGQISGDWKIDVRDADVAPFLPGTALPAFSLKGDGRFTSDPLGVQPEVSGAIRLALTELQRVSTAWAGIGPVNIASEFAVVLGGERVGVRGLKVDVSGTSPVLTVEVLQPFVYDSATSKALPKQPQQDLARLTLAGVPAAWIQPWLGDLKYTSAPVTGEWRVTSQAEELRIRPVSALTIGGITLDQADEPLLRAVDVSVALAATQKGGQWTAELIDMSARSGNRQLVKVSGEAGAESAKVTLDADLPALMAQPFAGGSSDVVGGRIQAELTAGYTENWKAALNFTASGLRTLDPMQLPDIVVKLTANGDAAGGVFAEMPVSLLAAGRRSDLLVKVAAKPRSGVMQVTGAITGESVHLPDLQVLAALAPQGSDKPAVSSSQPQVSAGPFWSGVEGVLTLAVQRLVYSPGVEVTELAGEVTVDAQTIALSQLTARIGAGGKLAMTGKLGHEPAQAQSYGLAGDLLVTGFDPGPFLRDAGSSRPPVLDGHFDLKGTVSGRAAEPAGLADTAVGRLKVTGSQGTLRALGVKVEAAANLGGAASTILGIIGAQTGNEDMLKYATRTKAATDVAKQLAAVNFDRLDMTLQRGENNDLAIRDIVLQAPMVRLTGGGGVKYQPGVPFLSQPLQVQLNLSAKDRLASGLSTLKLLGSEPDSAGFLPLTESIKLDGSLSQVSAAQLERLIRRALTR